MANIILFGVRHGDIEKKAADCLNSLAKNGDHLLIESPDEGGEINCDKIHPAYKRFNGKLKCYGVDVPIDENRRTYSDLAFKANLIYKYSPMFFDGAISGKDVTANIEGYANILLENAKVDYNGKETDPYFLNRNAKYLKKLAKSMSGLSMSGMQDFLIKENDRLATKAKHYEEKSRRGPTNNALVNELISHEQQIQSGHRVFAVVGDNHANHEMNSELNNRIIEDGKPVTIFRPK